MQRRREGDVDAGPREIRWLDREAVLAAAGPRLDELKREARGAVRALKRLMAFAFVLPVAFFLGFFVPAVLGLQFLAFAALAVGMLVVGVRAANRIFKARSKVMAAIAPALGLTFTPRPAAPIDLSGFDGTAYGSFLKYSRVQDVLAGARDGKAFQVFDAAVTARSKGPDGTWRAGHPPKWLEGFAFLITRVVRVEMPGRWTSRTVITRDAGLANRLSQPRGMSRVRLLDSRFESIFEVFSTDQTEARALLHPVFMERLIELEELFEDAENPPVAAFDGAAFLVALPLAQSEEEQQRLTKGKLSAVDDYVVDRILWELDMVMGVVEAAAGPDAGADDAAT